MLQYSDEELAGKRGYDLIHPDDCNYYSAAHQERTSRCHRNRIPLTSRCSVTAVDLVLAFVGVVTTVLFTPAG